MKYIIIGYDAVKSIVAHRKLQSLEYQECKEFTAFISGQTQYLELWDLTMTADNEGALICSNTASKKKGIAFDLSSFKGFKNIDKPQDILTIIQKVLRFGIRLFEGQPYSATEKNVENEMSIVWPFSGSNHLGYKIGIDRKPDARRMSKRGDFLLVFDDGDEKKQFVKPTYTVFKKAYERLTAAQPLKHQSKNTEALKTIGVVNLDTHQNLSIDATIGFEKWNFYLTENQKTFVERLVNGPERLEGAAGTGKTLTLILRAIHLIKEKQANNESYNILFITHSISTKNQIINIFAVNYPQVENLFDRTHSKVSLEVTTLQELSINHLGAGITVGEYLDRDAQDSKDYQLMMIHEAYSTALSQDFESYKEFCSARFINFINDVDDEELVEMLQHEIAVSIKGRANEDIEKYRELARFKHSIPVEKEGDLNFLFLVYQKYQDKLTLTGQFDSDDIILTTQGRLNTPIWRRRKELEGYNVTFIDETHLFNFNELAVFHHLNKKAFQNNIIFAVDKSQAIGDKGLSDKVLYDSLGLGDPESNTTQSSKYKTVFRSSPAIVNLAFEVLSSGTTLFTNFENPLDKVQYSFTAEEERKSRPPLYVFKENDAAIIRDAFVRADNLCKELNTKKSKVLIIATSPLLLVAIEKYANGQNKSYELLKNRGDAEVIKAADKSNRYVIGGIDYVGGLEFDTVIVVGVDKNRVPPVVSEESMDSYHFLNYAWHNRMYVAITRAKYILILIGEKSRGPSKLFESSIDKEILILEKGS
jgi:superfamily I DNA/RNA helicase